jgi:hypothetical protein
MWNMPENCKGRLEHGHIFSEFVPCCTLMSRSSNSFPLKIWLWFVTLLAHMIWPLVVSSYFQE